MRTAAGSASTWVVVDLTPDQEEQRKAHEHSENEAKAAAFVGRSGKSWLLKFANGSTVTYTSTGVDPDGMPEFQFGSGGTARIAVANDNKVMVLEGSCIRSGTLTGSQVKDGTSMGECTPAGNWTGTVTR